MPALWRITKAEEKDADGSAYSKYMGDAIFKVPTPLMLDKIVTAMDDMYEQMAKLSDTDARGDVYEFMQRRVEQADLPRRTDNGASSLLAHIRPYVKNGYRER